jgi:hypothetical protein
MDTKLIKWSMMIVMALIKARTFGVRRGVKKCYTK